MRATSVVFVLAVLLVGCASGGAGTATRVSEDPGATDTPAAAQIRALAKSGSAAGQAGLAAFYLEGSQGVRKDPVEGARWARKSAEQGYAMGQTLLGGCYVTGMGVPQDFEEGAKWLRLADAQGNADARVLLQQLQPLLKSPSR
jgi:TPR repeat protein